jgi:hypothetical protein
MGVSGQRDAPAVIYPQEKVPGTHCTGGWVGLRAGLDTDARGKILCVCWESNHGRPVCSQTLYWLSYPSSSRRPEVTTKWHDTRTILHNPPRIKRKLHFNPFTFVEISWEANTWKNNAMGNATNRLKPEPVYIMVNNAVRTVTKIKRLMLSKEIITAYSEKHTKPINTKRKLLKQLEHIINCL